MGLGRNSHPRERKRQRPPAPLISAGQGKRANKCLEMWRLACLNDQKARYLYHKIEQWQTNQQA
jgi:hypothetical protein